MGWSLGRTTARPMAREQTNEIPPPPSDEAIYRAFERAGLVSIRSEGEGARVVELTEHGRQVLANVNAGEVARRELAEVVRQI